MAILALLFFWAEAAGAVPSTAAANRAGKRNFFIGTKNLKKGENEKKQRARQGRDEKTCQTRWSKSLAFGELATGAHLIKQAIELLHFHFAQVAQA